MVGVAGSNIEGNPEGPCKYGKENITLRVPETL